MEDENKKETPVQDAVPTKPEETAPTTETPPPVTPPARADDDIRSVVSDLSSKVEELTGLVTGVIATGAAVQDSTPVRKPWTHWGGKKR